MNLEYGQLLRSNWPGYAKSDGAYWELTTYHLVWLFNLGDKVFSFRRRADDPSSSMLGLGRRLRNRFGYSCQAIVLLVGMAVAVDTRNVEDLSYLSVDGAIAGDTCHRKVYQIEIVQL